MKVVAFVPIRLNSKRVIGKNLKLLGGKPLLCYVFEQLVQVRNVDEIYAYCSSEEIVKYLPEGVKFLKRPESLDKDSVLGEDIYDSFLKVVDADIYILVHTTSPFIKAQTIENATNQVIDSKYDSALCVKKIQTFVWYDGKPLNYSLKHIIRTQDISPVYVETSAFYIFSRNTWLQKRQRVGDNPYFAEVDEIEGIDIDNPEDFELAESIMHSRIESVNY